MPAFNAAESIGQASATASKAGSFTEAEIVGFAPGAPLICVVLLPSESVTPCAPVTCESCPPHCKASALPIELRPQETPVGRQGEFYQRGNGGETARGKGENGMEGMGIRDKR